MALVAMLLPDSLSDMELSNEKTYTSFHSNYHSSQENSSSLITLSAGLLVHVLGDLLVRLRLSSIWRFCFCLQCDMSDMEVSTSEKNDTSLTH